VETTLQAVATMRAAVISAPGDAAVARVAQPIPGPGEVLVRIEGCGVCASSMPLWEGRPWFEYPQPAGAPGHEAWGVEVETGRRVALLSYHGFAEYDVAPAEAIVPLPSELDGLPFPGEALACAVNVFRRSRIVAGETVAIVGVGFLGRALARLCDYAGAAVVRVRRGVDTDGLHCPCVIETGGVQETLDVASRLVATRGRLVIAGFHQDGPRRVDLQSWNWRGLDVVNAHERDPAVYVEGIRKAAQLAAAGVLDLEELVTHRFHLERLNDAFEAARARPKGFVKAWVEP
jgi:threonine dehydrogenase-like Zn-dependent dehydrogenase